MDSQVEAFQAGRRDHLVLFYRDDVELTDRVGGYLLDCLSGGGAAIVLSTWEHRLSIARHLVQAGIDLAPARASGAYCELDASDTIDTFLAGSDADPASFWAEITPAIRRAAEGGRPVRIFGEMVALLWDVGQAGAAIEVEAMWNELAAQFSFSLLCAYPLWSVTGPGQVDQVTEVCRAHTAVTGEPPSSMRGWRF